MFSFIYARMDGWVYNRKARDLKRNRAHYDVTVMSVICHGSVSSGPFLSYRSIRHSLPSVWWYEMFAEIIHTAPFNSTVIMNIRTGVNSLWPSDIIWRQRSWSTLAQVMACCLTAPSHNLNQCWPIISEVQCHSYKDNYTRDASTTNHYNMFENYMSKFSFKFPRGQWVNLHTPDWLPFLQMTLIWGRDNIAQIPQNYSWE